MSSPQHSRPQKLQKKVDEPGRHCTCPAEPNISREKIWQSPKLFDLWAMSEKKMFCWRNVFSGVVNTAFHMFSREKVWDKRVFFKKKICLTFFSAFEWRNSGFVAEVFNKGCQKQNPRDQRNFLVKLYLEEDTTLCLLMVVLRKIWFAKKLKVRQ